MSNVRRVESQTGFYHVMVRGVNRQKIFCDNIDRKFFLKIMKEYSYTRWVEIHAFCLMENHVHILIKAEQKNLSAYMRDILTIYASYFNKKTNRVGHLFGDRFKSEPVNDEVYFLTVLRYILQNPEKACICKTNDYQWSSIGAYTKKSFVETDFALGFFNSVSELKKFVTERNNDECMDLDLTSEEKDVKARLIINYLLKEITMETFRGLPKYEKERYFREMNRNDISIKRIAEITGCSLYSIQKALCKK